MFEGGKKANEMATAIGTYDSTLSKDQPANA